MHVHYVNVMVSVISCSSFSDHNVTRKRYALYLINTKNYILSISKVIAFLSVIAYSYL